MSVGLACVAGSRPQSSESQKPDLFRNLLAPLLMRDLIAGRTQPEAQLLAFVQEEIALDPDLTRLVALIYLSKDPLEPLDRILEPVRGERVVELPYFSRPGSSVEDLALVLVERAGQRDSCGGATAAPALVMLRHSVEAGWIEQQESQVEGPPPRGIGTTFPGGGSLLVAPNGSSRVISRTSSSAHELLLVESRDGPPGSIYSFQRSVEVAWSSDSRWLLITDHRASDESSCVLLDLTSGLVTDILREFRQSDRFHWLENHHTYMSCVAWLGEENVLVRVVGYGDRDPSGFSRVYGYDARRKTVQEADGADPAEGCSRSHISENS